MTNIIIIILVTLILVNGFKGTERVWATLKITFLYHFARENNPESLGSSPEDARKKVEGFLQKTIWAALFHFINVLVCGALAWNLGMGEASAIGNRRGLFVVMSLISAFGSIFATVELSSGLFHTLKVHTTLVRLSPKYKEEQPTLIKMCIVTIPWIAMYTLTGVSAGYLIFTLY
jgi:hypothetical protein